MTRKASSAPRQRRGLVCAGNPAIPLPKSTFSVLIVLFLAFVGLSCNPEVIAPARVGETHIALSEQTLEDVFGDDTERLKFVALTGHYKIPAEEAKKTALETAMYMREAEGILDDAPLAVASFEQVRGDERQPVAADGPDQQEVDSVPDVYLVNFADDRGYVLLSGDERTAGVFAYSSYGNLGDAIDNPGQAILLQRVYDYIQNRRQRFEAMKQRLAAAAEEEMFLSWPKETQDSLVNAGLFDADGKRMVTKMEPPHDPCDYPCDPSPNPDPKPTCRSSTSIHWGPWKTVEKTGPLMKTLWHQGSGYNNDVTTTCSSGGSNGKAWAGCVATAVGQIMAFHAKPRRFKGRDMHWKAMTTVDTAQGHKFSGYTTVSSAAKKDISHLLFRLGDQDMLKMNYNCDGSGAYDCDALNALKKSGYGKAYAINYSSGRIVTEIRNKRPVYIGGYSQNRKRRCFLGFCRTIENYRNGHAWALDGYVKRKQKNTVTYTHTCNAAPPYKSVSTRKTELVHNNFGWGDVNDNKELKGKDKEDTGWYHIGLFDSNNGPDESSFRSDAPGNYRYKNQIIAGIE